MWSIDRMNQGNIQSQQRDHASGWQAFTFCFVEIHDKHNLRLCRWVRIHDTDAPRLDQSANRVGRAGK